MRALRPRVGRHHGGARAGVAAELAPASPQGSRRRRRRARAGVGPRGRRRGQRFRPEGAWAGVNATRALETITNGGFGRRSAYPVWSGERRVC